MSSTSVRFNAKFGMRRWSERRNALSERPDVDVETLYAAMPHAQKKVADDVFRKPSRSSPPDDELHKGPYIDLHQRRGSQI